MQKYLILSQEVRVLFLTTSLCDPGEVSAVGDLRLIFWKMMDLGKRCFSRFTYYRHHLYLETLLKMHYVRSSFGLGHGICIFKEPLGSSCAHLNLRTTRPDALLMALSALKFERKKKKKILQDRVSVLLQEKEMKKIILPACIGAFFSFGIPICNG